MTPPTNDTSDDMIGRVVGTYRLVRVLGCGGMGTVFLARSSTGEQVALKLLHRHLSGEQPHVDRFRREAAAGTQLQHPAILQTLTSGKTAEGEHFFAMEYFRGRTVGQLLKCTDGFSEAHALVIGYRVATALDYAHRQGFVHRDIKPANVMLNRTGSVVVADFGLAQVLGQRPASEIGAYLGTPAYSPPEQLRGEDLDGRADLYALGATLYEMLCGAPAFTGKTPMGLVLPVARGERVPLAERRDGLSPETVALVEALMTPDRDQRLATGVEAVEALAARLRACLLGLNTDEQFEQALGEQAQLIFLGTIEVDTETGWAEEPTPPETVPDDTGGDAPTAATAAWQEAAEEEDSMAAFLPPATPAPPPAPASRSPARRRRHPTPTPRRVGRYNTVLLGLGVCAFLLGAWRVHLPVQIAVPVSVQLLGMENETAQHWGRGGLTLCGTRAIPGLLAAVSTAEGAHRQRLYEVLRNVATVDAGNALLAVVADADPIVRAHAVAGLAAAAHPAAVEVARAALEDPDPRVRAAAVAGLDDVPPEYLPLLARAYVGADPVLRSRLTRVLAAAGSDALPPLREVWSDLGSENRRGVVQCVGRIGGPAATRMLVDRVDDPDLAVRFSIVETLQSLTSVDIGDDPRAWRAWARQNLE